ncbi:MAG: RNA 2',3'-cyclic phosphodiesterase [Deltaproteobacteria bacterium]|jgi:2'-5' RNA ligase|nr:RNA 2',3'-cyclic phosphodiesterase [Deltaproteobacteria bacterium]
MTTEQPKRLFIAVAFPPEVREAFLALRDVLDEPKILHSGNVHLTLRFLGDAAPELIPSLVEALKEVRAPRFDLAFSAFGSFRSGRGQILIAHLVQNDRLMELRKKIDAVVNDRFPFPREKKLYTPHATLARLPYPAKVVARAKDLGRVPAPGFPVTSFGLYQSVLTHPAAVHTLLSGFELDEDAPA